jgi:hypothetical protein
MGGGRGERRDGERWRARERERKRERERDRKRERKRESERVREKGWGGVAESLRGMSPVEGTRITLGE